MALDEQNCRGVHCFWERFLLTWGLGFMVSAFRVPLSAHKSACIGLVFEYLPGDSELSHCQSDATSIQVWYTWSCSWGIDGKMTVAAEQHSAQNFQPQVTFWKPKGGLRDWDGRSALWWWVWFSANTEPLKCANV